MYTGFPLNKPDGNNNYGTEKDALECQAKCQETKGCGWFNFDDEKDCWLKTIRGDEKPNPGGVSGPRICGEGKNYITPTLLTLSFQLVLNMKQITVETL